MIGGSAALYYFGKLGTHLHLTKVSFNQLPHWNQDEHNQALKAFQRSCQEIVRRSARSVFLSSLPEVGTLTDWQKICSEAQKLDATDKVAARLFFEKWFDPYRVTNNFNSIGLFTGYYLPLLHANLTKSKHYTVPIYGLPDDLIKVNLKLFQSDLAGKKIIGKLKGQALYPYPERAAITKGALHKTAQVIAWGNDELDVFFAQIQGSAMVSLPHGHPFIIGYAGDNGRSYTAIGKVLIQNKALTKKNVSMQTIREWLMQHPEKTADVLNANSSYVFFRRLKENDPHGVENVPLTPERSLAIDMRYIPLGVPIWLSTSIPDLKRKEDSIPFHQLLVTQDTGGAIKGIVRGDIYWGAGEKAAFIAGSMKNSGEYWLLLPKKG